MGMPLPFATFLIFMTLKLTGYIDWSWWFITAPVTVWILIYVVIGVVYEILKARAMRKFRK